MKQFLHLDELKRDNFDTVRLSSGLSMGHMIDEITALRSLAFDLRLENAQLREEIRLCRTNQETHLRLLRES